MNVSISRAALLPALAAACAVAPKHGPGSTVCLRATNASLIVQATDAEVAVSLRVTCAPDKLGEVYVPAHDLHRVVRGASVDSVVLQVGGNRFAVRAGGAVTRLPLSDDPWALPASGEGAGLTVAGEDLARILRLTTPAADPNTARHGLNGVHLETESGHLRAITTDGHRLHAASAPYVGDASFPSRQLVPPRAAKLIADAAVGSCRLVIGHGWGVLHHDAGELRFRMLDGDFPDYRAVVPVASDAKHIARVDRLDLLAALRRSEVALEDVSNATRLEITADGVTVRTASPERDHAETVTAAIEGEPITIGVRGIYLRDVLAAHTGDTVSLLIRHALAPVLIEDESAFYVIMPMRLD
jgi:DNA polymerase-3 subunit beta